VSEDILLIDCNPRPKIFAPDPKEIRALIADLMISVSGFFRDREAWQALDDTVLAPLVTEQKADTTSILGTGLRHR